MNFLDILVIIYLLGEFGCVQSAYNVKAMLFDEVQIPGDTAQKMKEVKSATKKAVNDINFRSSVQEPARYRRSKQKTKFERHTKITFTDTTPKPEHGQKSKRLWNKAKSAEDEYQTIKHKFEHGKFCNPPDSGRICANVFKNSYFKKENLSYDPSYSVPGNGCIEVSYTLEVGYRYWVDYKMEYKLCYAKKKENDGTESALIVFLQSTFKQPVFGGSSYFVLLLYLFHEKTQQWIRPFDPSDPDNIEAGKFRYEAYLYL